MSANNLGKYLHPPKLQGNPSDPSTPPTRRPRNVIRASQEPPMDTADDAASTADLTAEQRFYRSAKPAPVKGYR